MAKISLIVNGNPVNANVDPRTLLVQFLRENLRLTGTHVGCDTSQCGACVVHLDGKAVKSCTTLAVMADGHEVKTIEGLAADGAPLHPMQEAFREHHGLQCGFCTPGMIMTAVDLVHRKGHDLSDHVIREELEGNLCRCTGYQNIVASIAAGAKAMAQVRSRLIDFIATAIRKFSMYEFKYHRPATVRQAANLLVKNEDAKVIAGGHTLVPVMKQRLASPPHLVDLSHIEGLDAIEMKGRSLVIGATAKHATVATSPIVGEAIPGARRTRRPDRRSRGAPQGHHRRLARQQRSDRGLSRRPCSRSAPPSSPTSAASRRKSFFRACSRRRSKATRSSPR